jgi:hypothetical protein
MSNARTCAMGRAMSPVKNSPIFLMSRLGNADIFQRADGGSDLPGILAYRRERRHGGRRHGAKARGAKHVGHAMWAMLCGSHSVRNIPFHIF